MTRVEKVLATGKTCAVGGRDGVARSSDGRLDIQLSSPGQPGSGTNPEQLFAAAWSASLIDVMKTEAKRIHVTLPADLAIEAEVDLGVAGGTYILQGRLCVRLRGLERPVSRRLIDAAYAVCPYSRATRGNIDVVLTLHRRIST
jgi:lipoyl-dependent peroxiredoxin